MRRPWLTDLGLTVLVLLAQSAPFVFALPVVRPHLTLGDYLPLLVTSLPVLLRRFQPSVCLIVSSLGIAWYGIMDVEAAQPVWYGPLICFYTVAYQGRRWERIAAVVVTLAGGLSIIGSFNTAARELALWTAAYLLGMFARTRREALDQVAQLAAEKERTRIARDMHDILGHSLSLMIVQAEAGGAVARHDGAKAEAAFDAISAHGREAIGQLRTAVSALRGKTLFDDLPSLVRQTEHDGLAVRLRQVGEPRELGADVQLAAYRVVQEALTNVVKHSRASNVEVVMDWEVPKLQVSVVDNGRGVAPDVDGGHGLTGLRERVTAAGGTVEHGNLPGGGFQVKAVFA